MQLFPPNWRTSASTGPSGDRSQRPARVSPRSCDRSPTATARLYSRRTGDAPLWQRVRRQYHAVLLVVLPHRPSVRVRQPSPSAVVGSWSAAPRYVDPVATSSTSRCDRMSRNLKSWSRKRRRTDPMLGGCFDCGWISGRESAEATAIGTNSPSIPIGSVARPGQGPVTLFGSPQLEVEAIANGQVARCPQEPLRRLALVGVRHRD